MPNSSGSWPRERVRDKVAASRKKGKWTGGSVPLGYDSKDKRLIVNSAEAKVVRMIFNRYLALRSFQKLIDELNEAGIVTKRRDDRRPHIRRHSIHLWLPRLPAEEPDVSGRDGTQRLLVQGRA